MERPNQKDYFVLRAVLGGTGGLLTANSAALAYAFESYGFSVVVVASAFGVITGIGMSEAGNEFYQAIRKETNNIRGRLRLRGVPPPNDWL